MQPSYLLRNPGNELLYNRLTPLFLAILFLSPWLGQNSGIILTGFFLLVITSLICVRPVIGAHLVVFVLPVHGFRIAIFLLGVANASLGLDIAQIPSAKDLKWAIGAMEYWALYPFQLAAFLVVPALLFRQDNLFSNKYHFENRFFDRWMLFFPVAFIVWALFSLLWVSYPVNSAYSLFRFSSNFIIIIFVVTVLNRYDLIIRTLTVYFFFSFFYTISALLSTWYGDFYSWVVAQENLTIIRILLEYRNTGVSYDFILLGLADGYGWSAKHEFSMYIITAILISPILLRHYKSLTPRFFIICNVLLMCSIVFRGPTKVTILGSFLVIFALSFMLPKLHKYFILIMVVVITFNIAGFLGSGPLRIPIKNKLGMTTGNIENIASDSRHEVGSITFRLGLWQDTIDRIIRDRGMGAGGDALQRDPSFFSTHGCSLTFNIIHDYGVLGLVFIFMFILLPVKKTFKNVYSKIGSRNDIWWLQVCLLASLFTCLLDHSIDLFYWNPQIWFLLGLLSAALRLNPQNNPLLQR